MAGENRHHRNKYIKRPYLDKLQFNEVTLSYMAGLSAHVYCQNIYFKTTEKRKSAVFKNVDDMQEVGEEEVKEV